MATFWRTVEAGKNTEGNMIKLSQELEKGLASHVEPQIWLKMFRNDPHLKKPRRQSAWLGNNFGV